MIIKCMHCGKQVDAQVVGEYVSESEVCEGFYRFRMVVCGEPYCGGVMLLMQQAAQEFKDEPRECDWGEAEVVWPAPGPNREAENFLRLPDSVWNPLCEAQKCYSAGAYEMCAVACRMAVDYICQHNGVVHGGYGQKLSELCEAGIIDAKILEWGRLITGLGSKAAHEPQTRITEEDAKDLLDFTREMARYVFVLTEKFERFQSRRRRSDIAPNGNV
jgi:hypothetical protein